MTAPSNPAMCRRATASEADAAVYLARRRPHFTVELSTSRGGPAHLARARPELPARDEAHAPLHGDIGQGPLQHHHDAAAKSDQPEDVNESPDEPREEARHLQRPDV